MTRSVWSPRRLGCAVATAGALLGAAYCARSPSSALQHLHHTDPLIAAGLELAYGAPSGVAEPSGEPVTISVETGSALRELDERFASIAIDTSQLVGGRWWSRSGRVEVGRGTERVPPLDLTRAPLVRLARALSPAFLRVGGTEADHVYYAMNDAPVPPGYELVLDRDTWDALHGFTRDARLELFFTINAGPGARDPDGAWRSENAAALLAHARRSEQHVAIWELGNEVNGYWFIHGVSAQPSAARYAADLLEFRRVVERYQPHARIAGPASAYFPLVGEPVRRFLPDVLERAGSALDIVSWHYYPEQSRRCPVATRRAAPDRLLDPGALDEARRWALEIATARDRYAPAAELWLGETGQAQCGGEPGVSDRYVSGLWWLDQLGSAARQGQAVVVRQALVGADYGLLDPDTLAPRPDYYNTLLWKKLMGARVLEVRTDGQNPFVRAYAHCGRQVPGSVAVLVLNQHAHRPATFRLAPSAAELIRYELSAPDLASRDLYLEGRPLTLQRGELPPLVGSAVAPTPELITLGPASYAFFELLGAEAQACASSGPVQAHTPKSSVPSRDPLHDTAGGDTAPRATREVGSF